MVDDLVSLPALPEDDNDDSIWNAPNDEHAPNRTTSQHFPSQVLDEKVDSVMDIKQQAPSILVEEQVPMANKSSPTIPSSKGSVELDVTPKHRSASCLEVNEGARDIVHVDDPLVPSNSLVDASPDVVIYRPLKSDKVLGYDRLKDTSVRSADLALLTPLPHSPPRPIQHLEEPSQLQYSTGAISSDQSPDYKSRESHGDVVFASGIERQEHHIGELTDLGSKSDIIESAADSNDNSLIPGDSGNQTVLAVREIDEQDAADDDIGLKTNSEYLRSPSVTSTASSFGNDDEVEKQVIERASTSIETPEFTLTRTSSRPASSFGDSSISTISDTESSTDSHVTSASIVHHETVRYGGHPNDIASTTISPLDVPLNTPITRSFPTVGTTSPGDDSDYDVSERSLIETDGLTILSETDNVDIDSASNAYVPSEISTLNIFDEGSPIMHPVVNSNPSLAVDLTRLKHSLEASVTPKPTTVHLVGSGDAASNDVHGPSEIQSQMNVSPPEVAATVGGKGKLEMPCGDDSQPADDRILGVSNENEALVAGHVEQLPEKIDMMPTMVSTLPKSLVDELPSTKPTFALESALSDKRPQVHSEAPEVKSIFEGFGSQESLEAVNLALVDNSTPAILDTVSTGAAFPVPLLASSEIGSNTTLEVADTISFGKDGVYLQSEHDPLILDKPQIDVDFPLVILSKAAAEAEDSLTDFSNAPSTPRSELGVTSQFSDTEDDTRSEVSQASFKPVLAPSSPQADVNELSYFEPPPRHLWKLEMPAEPGAVFSVVDEGSSLGIYGQGCVSQLTPDALTPTLPPVINNTEPEKQAEIDDRRAPAPKDISLSQIHPSPDPPNDHASLEASSNLHDETNQAHSKNIVEPVNVFDTQDVMPSISTPTNHYQPDQSNTTQPPDSVISQSVTDLEETEQVHPTEKTLPSSVASSLDAVDDEPPEPSHPEAFPLPESVTSQIEDAASIPLPADNGYSSLADVASPSTSSTMTPTQESRQSPAYQLRSELNQAKGDTPRSNLLEAKMSAPPISLTFVPEANLETDADASSTSPSTSSFVDELDQESSHWSWGSKDFQDADGESAFSQSLAASTRTRFPANEGASTRRWSWSTEGGDIAARYENPFQQIPKLRVVSQPAENMSASVSSTSSPFSPSRRKDSLHLKDPPQSPTVEQLSRSASRASINSSENTSRFGTPSGSRFSSVVGDILPIPGAWDYPAFDGETSAATSSADGRRCVIA